MSSARCSLMRKVNRAHAVVYNRAWVSDEEIAPFQANSVEIGNSGGIFSGRPLCLGAPPTSTVVASRWSCMFAKYCAAPSASHLGCRRAAPYEIAPTSAYMTLGSAYTKLLNSD